MLMAVGGTGRSGGVTRREDGTEGTGPSREEQASLLSLWKGRVGKGVSVQQGKERRTTLLSLWKRSRARRAFSRSSNTRSLLCRKHESAVRKHVAGPQPFSRSTNTSQPVHNREPVLHHNTPSLLSAKTTSQSKIPVCNLSHSILIPFLHA